MIKKILSFIILGIVIIGLSGCGPKTLSKEATIVELVNEKPDTNSCKFLGEIVGSQGNWFTGDFTSNEDLVVGARNELRNKAHKLGGNIVYIQDMKNTNKYSSLGTTNTTAIGKVYNCIN